MRGVALLVGLLLALCTQSILIQTHLHAPVEDRTMAGQGVDAGARHHVGHQHKGSDPATDCPICQEQALSGHYLAPAPVLLVMPVHLDLWLLATALHVQPSRWRSHIWRSRAPPASLQH